ncbi:hypothetical protein F8G81_01120 [Arthrobacter sp. CDRTa11]|nr:hypothetical protein F8G81_01120 [Arthrobacter sp. CDRTa11]
MVLFPDPSWPILVLAGISLVDGFLCIKPAPFIAKCFEDVHWPQRHWWLMTPIKFAAAAGLIAGLWIPGLGALTTACLILYFLIAIGMHIRARDFGRNLFLNAFGMLAICITTGLYSFIL